MTNAADSDDHDRRPTLASTGPRESRGKTEPSLANNAEILLLVTRFASCRWPCDQWTHRAHLAAGLMYLECWPFKEALARLRDDIVRYNSACGRSTGYHETITVFFLRRIAAHRAAHPRRSWPDMVQDLTTICSTALLDEYFSRSRLDSPAARETWQPPDLKRIDF